MTFNAELAKITHGVDNEHELRKMLYCTRSDLTPAEFECILTELDAMRSPMYVEVGVYFGGTFKRVLDHISKSELSHAIGIDLFEDIAWDASPRQTHELYNKWNTLNVAACYELDAALRERGHTKFHLVKGNSDEMIGLVLKECGPCVVFLDGNHSYDQTMKDFMAVKNATWDHCTVIFHNASDDIQPDPQYVAVDGGPWKVCEDIVGQGLAKHVKSVDRCQVFYVEREYDR